jgi:hypothetical protein
MRAEDEHLDIKQRLISFRPSFLPIPDNCRRERSMPRGSHHASKQASAEKTTKDFGYMLPCRVRGVEVVGGCVADLGRTASTLPTTLSV